MASRTGHEACMTVDDILARYYSVVAARTAKLGKRVEPVGGQDNLMGNTEAGEMAAMRHSAEMAGKRIESMALVDTAVELTNYAVELVALGYEPDIRSPVAAEIDMFANTVLLAGS